MTKRNVTMFFPLYTFLFSSLQDWTHDHGLKFCCISPENTGVQQISLSFHRHWHMQLKHLGDNSVFDLRDRSSTKKGTLRSTRCKIIHSGSITRKLELASAQGTNTLKF
jgi:hypothetical protein